MKKLNRKLREIRGLICFQQHELSALTAKAKVYEEQWKILRLNILNNEIDELKEVIEWNVAYLKVVEDKIEAIQRSWEHKTSNYQGIDKKPLGDSLRAIS